MNEPLPIVPVAVAIGSNLGDRRAHLEWATTALRQHLDNLIVSSVIETDPVDVSDVQPRYLNAVAVGETRLPARKLLDWLLSLERERGRVREGLRRARTLDLDLILYGDSEIHETGLVVPHPRFRDRGFVLRPLAALVPDWVDPVTGRSMKDLAGDLPEGS